MGNKATACIVHDIPVVMGTSQADHSSNRLISVCDMVPNRQISHLYITVMMEISSVNKTKSPCYSMPESSVDEIHVVMHICHNNHSC